MSHDATHGEEYRKKPVVIRAKQWFKNGDHPEVKPQNPEKGVPGWGWIWTLESSGQGHVVTPGDWIIQGVKGEFYACKPDIFEATYEPASTVSETPRKCSCGLTDPEQCVSTKECCSFPFAVSATAALADKLREADAARYRWLNGHYELQLRLNVEDPGQKDVVYLKCGKPLDTWIDQRIAEGNEPARSGRADDTGAKP